jgi:hypothetical protein
MLEKLVSGGQTGVDRAGLDAAIELGLAHGGWCPKGRKAEDGVIPAIYSLRETPGAQYLQRTEWNVRDADATLVLSRGKPTGGTLATIDLAASQNRPCLVVDLLRMPRPETVRAWLSDNHVKVLNIAGPRESSHPGVHDQALIFLQDCLKN